MQPQSTSNIRRHDIDALRAIAFGLLILYHVGMYYVSWGWHVKSQYPAEWLEPFMTVVNQWRMPLIFLISGMATNFLLGEDEHRKMGVGQFVWLRRKRLGWPLLFGMLIIIPPQAYFEARFNAAFNASYPEFLIRYFTFQPWAKDAFAGSNIGITWNHLWYLPYLLSYTLLLALVLKLAPGPLAILRNRFRRLRGIWLILLPVLWLLPIGLFVYPIFPYISHDLLTDGYAHLMYGTFFMLGYLIGRDPGIWQSLQAMRKPLLILAIFSIIGVLLRNEFVSESPSKGVEVASLFLTYLNRWVWIAMILGWGHQLLNRPMAWLRYANLAVYPWYILHQTIIVIVGYYFSRWALGPVLEPVLLFAVTIAGCAGGTWLVEHHLPWLRTAMGMKVARRSGKTADPKISLKGSVTRL